MSTIPNQRVPSAAETPRSYFDAQDYWDMYYFDDERNRSALDPEAQIAERLQSSYPEMHWREAAVIGRLARDSIVERLG